MHRARERKADSLPADGSVLPDRHPSAVQRGDVALGTAGCVAGVLLAACMTGCRPAARAVAVADKAPSGGRLYATYCLPCHGADGRNDRQGAEPQMRLLTAATQPVGTWRDVVLRGRNAMPAFAGRLRQPDVDAIRAYVQTLRPSEHR